MERQDRGREKKRVKGVEQKKHVPDVYRAMHGGWRKSSKRREIELGDKERKGRREFRWRFYLAHL